MTINRRRFCVQSLPVLSSPWLLAGCTAQREMPGTRSESRTDAEAAGLSTWVNPFIGTGGHGHTFPGASLPFGMVQLSPDTYNAVWDSCSGYHRNDGSIMGFSHTHLSGTGIGDMLDVLVVPATGAVKLVPGDLDHPEQGYRSRYSHASEVAEPGYYRVYLQDTRITAELTATARTGLHRYTFPNDGPGHFMIDLAHGMQDRPRVPTRVSEVSLRVLGNTRLLGGRRVHQWAKGRYCFFAMEFARPFAAFEVYRDEESLGALRQLEGGTSAVKCVLKFPDAGREPVVIRTGISFVSAENALKNLEAEATHVDFDQAREAARVAWDAELGKVRIETADPALQTIFYTALYHSLLAPTLCSDVDGSYRGMDLKVQRVSAGMRAYTAFSLWDTYRAEHPLLTLIQPERVPDLVNSLLAMAEQSPAGVPVWPLQGVETGCMTGYHSSAVLAEAWAKGFAGIDWKRAWPLWRKRALEESYRGLTEYRRRGWIPVDLEEEAVSKTLEYAYDDWACARLARAAGADSEALLLERRSRNYAHVFDPKIGFVRPRLSDGSWVEPFDPRSLGHTSRWRDFTECNAWQATFMIQHDVAYLIELLGGAKSFIAKLDALFEASSELPPDAPPDIAGLLGQYAHGNEPSHHIAYLYSYAGAPYKTQQRVRHLLQAMYSNTPDGLAGNEDCGQMSAWFVLSALGFYPVDPVSGHYVIGSPLIDRAEIQVGSGKLLVIEVRNNSARNGYVQSVTLNGEPWKKSWLRHADLVAGARIVFEMGPEPKFDAFGTAPADLPPSLIS